VFLLYVQIWDPTIFVNDGMYELEVHVFSVLKFSSLVIVNTQTGRNMWQSHSTKKVKVNFTLEQATKAQWGVEV
jgi:hypothetical protein